MMTEASEIYKKLAEKHGLSVEQVREAVIYFWRNGVKRGLESMISSEVYIPKLGSFKIKDWKLKYIIPQSLELSQREGMHERYVEYFKMLNSRLEEVQKTIKERENKYNEFLRQNPRSIQEPPSDLGRASEQGVQE